MSKVSARTFGYTLVEILIVISIIGLFTGAGIVEYRSYSRRQALTSATRSLVADIRLAQEYALSGKRPTGCTPDIDLIGYYFKITAANYTVSAACTALPANYPVVKTVLTPSGITYTPAGNFTFKVLGAGLLTGANYSITVKQPSTNTTQTVTVTHDGQITWQ